MLPHCPGNSAIPARASCHYATDAHFVANPSSAGLFSKMDFAKKAAYFRASAMATMAMLIANQEMQTAVFKNRPFARWLIFLAPNEDYPEQVLKRPCFTPRISRERPTCPTPSPKTLMATIGIVAPEAAMASSLCLSSGTGGHWLTHLCRPARLTRLPIQNKIGTVKRSWTFLPHSACANAARR